MDTMAILMATTIEAMVTGIVVIVVQGVVRVIGDEIKAHGKASTIIEAFPLQSRHSHPDCPTLIVASASLLHHDYDTISRERGTP